MAHSEIKPALTAEEWARVFARNAYDDPYTEIAGYNVRLNRGDYYSLEVVDTDGWYYTHELTFYGGERQQLAALCFHGQPFGFTRQDVKVLRGAQSALNFECMDRGFDRPCTLADRIEALLPPEGE